MSNKMREQLDKFKNFNLNENNFLKFSYRGTELPTQKMIDWFDFSFNQPPEDMDDLESDMWSTQNMNDFFDQFSDELSQLSYFEMIDVYEKSRDLYFY